MGSIYLPVLDITATREEWDDFVRKFAVEDQYNGDMLAKDFLELTAWHDVPDPDAPLEDTLDLIRFKRRQAFAGALRKKYRQGEEFSKDSDAETIFDKIFIAAEAVALHVLKSDIYIRKTLFCVEIYYWVILQLVRIDRGERIDTLNRGNQARLGSNLDLLGDSFAGQAAHFIVED